MGGILHTVAYGATGLAFAFVILSLACGLYYLAELVEEYSVYTKKVIKTTTAVIVGLHVLFWFDGLPFLQLVFSILCHLVYSLNLKTFPFISLTSVPFIASCLLVFVDHFIWFKYFTTHYKPFMDIAAFFGLCVWLIPFAYFISLSANDNALPMSGDPTYADTLPQQQKQGLMKTLLSYVGIKSHDTIPVSTADYNQNAMYSTPPPPPSTTTSAMGASSSMNSPFMSGRGGDIHSRKFN